VPGRSLRRRSLQKGCQLIRVINSQYIGMHRCESGPIPFSAKLLQSDRSLASGFTLNSVLQALFPILVSTGLCSFHLPR
jgi:hypothetical protein